MHDDVVHLCHGLCEDDGEDGDEAVVGDGDDDVHLCHGLCEDVEDDVGGDDGDVHLCHGLCEDGGCWVGVTDPLDGWLLKLLLNKNDDDDDVIMMMMNVMIMPIDSNYCSKFLCINYKLQIWPRLLITIVEGRL